MISKIFRKFTARFFPPRSQCQPISPKSSQKISGTSTNPDSFSTDDGISLEAAERFLPKYLLADDRRALFEELRNINNGFTSYYTGDLFPFFLQGDGVPDLPVANLETGEVKKVRGIIFSNTCDISPENKRILPMRVCFSPVIRLDKVVRLLEGTGTPANRLEDWLREVRRQEITSVFYLPKGGALDAEYLAFMDDAHSAPLSVLNEIAHSSRFFTLSQSGIWILTMKISIHFCRLMEDVNRSPRT